MAPSSSPRRRKSLGRKLIDLIWIVPLMAVPFALFFLLISGNDWRAFPIFYELSAVFAAFAGLANIIAGATLEPMVAARFADRPQVQTFAIGAMYLSVSVLGAMTAALVVHFTIAPGLLGDARSIAVMLTYTLLFGVLFVGLAFAASFYQKAMDRAGSDRELQLARTIQRSFLLTEFPKRLRLDVHALNVSSREVSGDFYDVVSGPDGSLLLAIADVSGKGVPAAILSSMLQASLRTQAFSGTAPGAMMATINTLACQRTATGQFATFFLASVHEPTLQMRYTNAGHNLPVLVRSNGERVLLDEGGLLVGMIDETAYQEAAVALQPGDRVLMYTDGVTEAQNAAGEMFGEDRLYALLAAAPASDDAQAIVARVLAGVRTFLDGTEAGDDITIMALRVLPPPPPGA